jgi:hypothetical protein
MIQNVLPFDECWPRAFAIASLPAAQVGLRLPEQAAVAAEPVCQQTVLQLVLLVDVLVRESHRRLAKAKTAEDCLSNSRFGTKKALAPFAELATMMLLLAVSELLNPA